MRWLQQIAEEASEQYYNPFHGCVYMLWMGPSGWTGRSWTGLDWIGNNKPFQKLLKVDAYPA